MLDVVAELVWRAPASQAPGALGDRAASPGDQAAPPASCHQGSPEQQRGSTCNREKLKEVCPHARWNSADGGHGGRRVSQQHLRDKRSNGSRRPEQICSWHQDRAIAGEEGLGEGVRNSQSPHGDGCMLGTGDHTMEQHDSVRGGRQLEGGAPSITGYASVI